MINTLGLNILQLMINFPAPIIFAILMSELISDRFKKFVQTVTFFPHFISWVVFGGIFLSLLDYDTGIVNTLFVEWGLLKEPVDILALHSNGDVESFESEAIFIEARLSAGKPYALAVMGDEIIFALPLIK